MFHVDPNLIVECSKIGGCGLLRAVVVSFLLFFTLLTGFAYLTVLERRLLAFLQDRIGPNRAGPLGLLQPLADGIKLIFKEDVVPVGADRAVFLIAPIIKTIPALLVVAVIPIGPPLLIPWFDGLWYRVPLGLTDVNVGVLYILAWMSLGTYGVALAGWSSSNKYSMLGGLRASAQMVSYELSMGLTMAVPILITGTMSLRVIIDSQANPALLGWYVFQNPISALILIIAMFAETSRAPFDLPEADSELTGGYLTEYSGMKFALFYMAEYISMISVSLIVVALYFGGYHFILVDQVPILGPLVFFGKVFLFLCLMIWVRATLPRIRYDRLMAFGWKVMLPLAILGVAWSTVALIIGDAFNSTAVYLGVSTVFFIVAVVIVLALLRQPSEGEQRGDQPVVLESKDFRFILLAALGGLLSVPVILWNGLTGTLGGISKALRDDGRPAAPK